MKKSIVTLKPTFHVGYNLIITALSLLPVLAAVNIFVNDSFLATSSFTVYWTFTILATCWAATYFYTQYTQISFFKTHVEKTFEFIISSRQIVPYKNIRQVDFFRGPVSNPFDLTSVKLMSSATVGQNSTGGITARYCQLSDDEEKKIYKTIAAASDKL